MRTYVAVVAALAAAAVVTGAPALWLAAIALTLPASVVAYAVGTLAAIATGSDAASAVVLVLAFVVAAVGNVALVQVAGSRCRLRVRRGELS